VSLVFGISLPVDADLEARSYHLVEFHTPEIDQLRIGKQIWNLRRNIFERRAQNSRQAQQRRVHIKRWQRISSTDQQIDPFTSADQLQQRLVTFEQHLATALLD